MLILRSHCAKVRYIFYFYCICCNFMCVRFCLFSSLVINPCDAISLMFHAAEWKGPKKSVRPKKNNYWFLYEIFNVCIRYALVNLSFRSSNKINVDQLKTFSGRYFVHNNGPRQQSEISHSNVCLCNQHVWNLFSHSMGKFCSQLSSSSKHS